MKLVTRILLVIGLVTSFSGVVLIDHGMMMNNASSICATHCMTLSGSNSQGVAPAVRTVLSLLGLLIIVTGSTFLAKLLLGIAATRPKRQIRPPIKLYRLNMTYIGYLL